MGPVPLLVMGVAMAAASAAMQQRAQDRETDARNKAFERSFDEQEEHRGEAKQVFEGALEGQTREQQDAALAEVEAEREQAISDNLQGGRGIDNFVPVSGSAPDVVQSEIGKRLGAALNEGRENARRVAQLGAFGDQQFENQIKLGRSRDELGRIASFSAGDANLLPFALHNAAQAGRSQRMAADIFGGLSSAAFSGAGGGGFAGAFGAGSGAAAGASGPSGGPPKFSSSPGV